jgi:hypothetical protein
MSSVNRCSMLVNRCLVFIIASMVVLGEKLDGGPTDRSDGVLGIVSGVIFLWTSRVCRTLLGQHERFPHTGNGRGKHTCGIHRLAQQTNMSCVSGFFTLLNHRDS